MREETLLSLIDHIYVAAEAPGHWPVFLEALSEAMNSKMTVLLYQNMNLERASVQSGVRIDPECVRLYGEYYSAKNIFFQAPQTLIAKRVFDENVVDRAALLSSEYYNDFLRPYDVKHAAAVTMRNDGEVAALVSTMRSSRTGPFDRDELRLLDVLGPHMLRALELHERLSATEARASLAFASLDCIRQAVIVVDPRGLIVFANEEAVALFRSGQGVESRHGALRLVDSRADSQLRRMIRESVGPELAAAETLTARSRWGAESFRIFVAPIASHDDRANQPMAAVMIDDLTKTRLNCDAVLRNRFGFTPAEGRVAERLVLGNSINEIAEDLHLSPHTIRTQLKSMFRKTNTTRQAQLVALLITTR